MQEKCHFLLFSPNQADPSTIFYAHSTKGPTLVQNDGLIPSFLSPLPWKMLLYFPFELYISSFMYTTQL